MAKKEPKPKGLTRKNLISIVTGILKALGFKPDVLWGDSIFVPIPGNRKQEWRITITKSNIVEGD